MASMVEMENVESRSQRYCHQISTASCGMYSDKPMFTVRRVGEARGDIFGLQFWIILNDLLGRHA